MTIKYILKYIAWSKNLLLKTKIEFVRNAFNFSLINNLSKNTVTMQTSLRERYVLITWILHVRNLSSHYLRCARIENVYRVYSILNSCFYWLFVKFANSSSGFWRYLVFLKWATDNLLLSVFSINSKETQQWTGPLCSRRSCLNA